MSVTIKVEQLTKTFILHNQGGVELSVFHALDFEATAGETIVLHGRSGVGKSSLLRMLFGNYKPSGGRILIRHQSSLLDIASAAPRTLLDVRRKSIGYVSQFLRVIPRVTAVDVVCDRMLSRGVDQRLATERAQVMLARLNLPERLWNLAPSTFSGGEQQRVNIARSFVDPAPILLLDEPTASLDSANRDVVIQLIHDVREAGHTLVGVFHDEGVRHAVATRTLDIASFDKAA